MRVLVCPDKFAGTLSAPEVAAAVVEGWRSVAPDDELSELPLADGGPGFVEVIHANIGGRLVDVATSDPLGRPVNGTVLFNDMTAYVESAQACGLHLLAADERDPKFTTSYGLAALIATALEYSDVAGRDVSQSGVREVVVGLGGSATNDGGAGLLAALGAVPLDAAGYALSYGGAALLGCERLDGRPRLRGARLVAATDVDSPLTGLYGASSVFGPQKGASRSDVLLLDAALERYAAVLERDLPGCPPGLAALPGAGAAGGLGAAILACGGRRESGIGLVRRLAGLDTVLAECDLVITGEGSFDEQSLRGKVVAGVAEGARDLGVPCVVLAGQVSAGRREALAAGITESHSLVEYFGSEEEAMRRPADGLRALAARVAGQWTRVRRPGR